MPLAAIPPPPDNNPTNPHHLSLPAAKGVADPNAAGLFTSLIRRAGALAAAGASGENAEEALLAPPTVLMETERQ